MARSYKKKNNSVESKFSRVKMSLFPLSKPDFRKRTEPKDKIILEWLKTWIKNGLNSGIIKENMLLPIKADLAYYFGVGEGTVQTAIRKLEDEGLVASKQRIGTLIMPTMTEKQSLNKLTSKRDKIVMQLKKYIHQNVKVGEVLPPVKNLMEIFDIKRNTLRTAIEVLESEKIIEDIIGKDDLKMWKVIGNISAEEITAFSDEIETKTLAQKISAQLEEYISSNLKIGDRLEPIKFWAEYFKTSEKTAYDAMQILLDKGVISIRRGKYGTIVAKMPNSNVFDIPKETSIFMPAEQAALYSYQRIENIIRNQIRNDYSLGSKLPSMKELSIMLDVSTNTIRKAVLRLADEGYLQLERGRFGGIYVSDIPETQTQSFRWLAVNPQYVKSFKN